jgi:hypothetical protein
MTVRLFSVMAMKVSRSNDFALTISADNLVCRYNLLVRALSNQTLYFFKIIIWELQAKNSSPEIDFIARRTKHSGNGSLAIRDDGKVTAVGGWDGK